MKRIALIFLLFTGCARVNVEHEYGAMQESVKCRTGHTFCWERSCEEAECIHSIVATTLTHSLTRNEAVEIALSNNPDLQAAYEDLGLAKAAIVQAGLLTNPSISIDYRFPSGLSSVESSLRFAAADLWLLPIRKQMACAEQKIVHAHLLNQVLQTKADAIQNYYRRKHSAAKLDLMGQLVDESDQIRQRVTHRQAFGYTTDLDIAMADTTYAMQLAMLLDAERMDMMANLELRKALGLDDSFPSVAVPPRLRPPDTHLPPKKALVKTALACNPEIAALQHEIALANTRIRLARARIFRQVDLGIAQTKDPGEANGFGPSIGIQLPIFDQNQAQIARAQFLLRKRCKELQAKRIEISTLVRETAQKYITTQQQLRVYRNEVIPYLDRAIDYATRYGISLQINLVIILESFRSRTGAYIRMLDLTLETHEALATLEALTGQAI